MSPRNWNQAAVKVRFHFMLLQMEENMKQEALISDEQTKGSHPLKKAEFYEKFHKTVTPPSSTASMKSLFKNFTVFLVHMYF